MKSLLVTTFAFVVMLTLLTIISPSLGYKAAFTIGTLFGDVLYYALKAALTIRNLGV